MKILLVEDEQKIAQAIKQGLEQEHIVVDTTFDGITGFDLALSEEYDLLILDRLLPGMDGLTLCAKLREKDIHTPILMLTAKAQVHDRVEGLNTGADDYLTKPFAFEELLARVKSLARRPQKMQETILRVSNLSLDTQNYTILRGSTKIVLSAKEFSLLEFLMQNSNKTLTKDQIISHVWHYDTNILPNTVEVFIKYLRNKIDKPFPREKILIHTVRGFGYMIGEEK